MRHRLLAHRRADARRGRRAGAELADLAGLRFDGLMTYPTLAPGRGAEAPRRGDSPAIARTGSTRDGAAPAARRRAAERASCRWRPSSGPARTSTATARASRRRRRRSRTARCDIVATVVSRPTADRGILDAGSKTLTNDPAEEAGGGGHGLIVEYPEVSIARFAEEHGHVDLARSNTRPNVGDVVRIVPNHVCVVVNMMDEVVMVRGEEIIGMLPVAARGKLR